MALENGLDVRGSIKQNGFYHAKPLEAVTFGISRKYGFLGDTLPLKKLPGSTFGATFGEWESILTRLPECIKKRSLRDTVDQLPEVDFSESTLKTEGEWRYAYLLLSFIGQAYIWMEGESGIVDKVPQKIAVPWERVSRHLGLKPVGTYASTVLYNFGVVDPSRPWDTLDNLYAISTYTGTHDESHFFLVHVVMEMAGAPAICAICAIYGMMEDGDDEGIIDQLRKMRDSLVKIQEVVDQMYDGCDPKTFFVKIRPFFAGSAGLDVFPNGIVYEGVDSVPRKYHGASAGQSSVIFALDEFLGIVQSGEVQEFVAAMIDYMPKPHRQFLLKQKEMPSFPDYCKKSGNGEMVAGFNEVVDELVKFRNQHLVLVTRYIINQKESSINPSLDERGTGGSHAVSFLKGVRDRTIAGKIAAKS